MNRFFVDKIEESMVLGGDNHSHIAYSLRLRVGEEIVLFCGDGFDYRYKISYIKKNETGAELIAKTENKSESGVKIGAFVSLIKHDKMSFVYQKLTELGVAEFFPVAAEFSQGKKTDFNIDRYGKICVEACKQCNRSVVPKVNQPLGFDALPTVFSEYDSVIFAYEKAEKSLKESLREQTKEGKKLQNIAVLIGPEGGFSQSEAQLLVSSGITPISLGKRILRAETAAIAAVGAVLYELDW